MASCALHPDGLSLEGSIHPADLARFEELTNNIPDSQYMVISLVNENSLVKFDFHEHQSHRHVSTATFRASPDASQCYAHLKAYIEGDEDAIEADDSSQSNIPDEAVPNCTTPDNAVTDAGSGNHAEKSPRCGQFCRNGPTCFDPRCRRCLAIRTGWHQKRCT